MKFIVSLFANLSRSDFISRACYT